MESLFRRRYYDYDYYFLFFCLMFLILRVRSTCMWPGFFYQYTKIIVQHVSVTSVCTVYSCVLFNTRIKLYQVRIIGWENINAICFQLLPLCSVCVVSSFYFLYPSKQRSSNYYKIILLINFSFIRFFLLHVTLEQNHGV